MITVRSASRSRATAASSSRASAVSSRGSVVEREVDEGRAGVRRPRGQERLVDERRDLRRRPGRRRVLGERPHERHVIDLLERSLAPAELRRASAEHDHRRAVLLRRGQGAHPVGDARPRGQRRHARLARDLGPALGGEGRRLLVADVDQRDALLAAAVVDREEVAAAEREQRAHAVGLEPLRDQPAAVNGLGVHGHGREATRSRALGA
jgi:hypothetical protein